MVCTSEETLATTVPGLKFYDYKSRKITIMGAMEKYPFGGAPGFSVSPDGRFVLDVQLDEAKNNSMLAENFR
jgi:hypothetical protein